MLDRERLSAITDNVVYDEPMSKHTTFRIGGTADAFVSPENALEIEKIIHFCKDTDTPYMLMGNGSNMLVGDGGIEALSYTLETVCQSAELRVKKYMPTQEY